MTDEFGGRVLRMVWLFLIGCIFGYGAVRSETLVLDGFEDAQSARIASLKLQLWLAEHPSMEQSFPSHALKIRTRHYGRLYALTVGPVRSEHRHNALLVALGTRYPGMFFITSKQHLPVPSLSAGQTKSEPPMGSLT